MLERLWAYTYEVLLPIQEGHLRKLQSLLDQEHSEAKDGARTWAGRVVVEPQIVRILVVSDSPTQAHDVNRRLEAELKLLGATLEISVPLPVEDDGNSTPMSGRPPMRLS